MRKLSTAALAAALVIAPASLAWAGGSDAPTPYTVTAEGIALPKGVTFQPDDHINVEGNLGAANLHLEAKYGDADNVEWSNRPFDPENPKGKYIYSSFIPWSALGFDAQALCVTWVQVNGYNEHFGEGKGKPDPVGHGCEPAGSEPTEPTPTDEPTENPAEPTEEPTGPATPTESTPPTDPEEAEEDENENTTTSETPTETGDTDDSTVGRPQWVAVTPDVEEPVDAAGEESVEAVRAQSAAELPRTGATVAGALAAAGALVLAGTGALLVRRRRAS
ncbi:LPXTG cell wall anchor domain-containing protein [Isoptericola croceus]|uniref:LPXTG cell wall anchor domain-containing protein n=1 Tax=Isoptericola croceus TaxID=3031406 RepID=UPI0023F7B0AB|nr:LPXTG cell wall anchor domain-containing protein [Isoptericola croceus]